MFTLVTNRRGPVLWVATIALTLFITAPVAAERDPGDLNLDGACNLADVVYLLEFLYAGGPPPAPIVEEPKVSGRLILGGAVEPIARTVRLVVRRGDDLLTFETQTHPQWGTFEFPVEVRPTDWVLVHLTEPTEPACAVLRGFDAAAGAPAELHIGGVTLASPLAIEDLALLGATAVSDPTGAVLFDWDPVEEMLTLEAGTDLRLLPGVQLRALTAAVPPVDDLIVSPGASLLSTIGLVIEGDLIAEGWIDTGGWPIWMAGVETAELRTTGPTLPGLVVHKSPGAAVHLEGVVETHIEGDLIINCGRLEVSTPLRVEGWTSVAPDAEFEAISATEGVALVFEEAISVASTGTLRVALPYGSLLVGDAIRVFGTGTIDLLGSPGRPLMIRPLDATRWTFEVAEISEVNVYHVEVVGSDASPGDVIHAYDSVDLGRNTNWMFH